MDFLFDGIDPDTDDDEDEDGGSSWGGSRSKGKVPQDDPDPGDPVESASGHLRRGPAQLRGLRLLSGAAPNAEECRSILASAKRPAGL